MSKTLKTDNEVNEDFAVCIKPKCNHSGTLGDGAVSQPSSS
jgi:hypothetical protein